MRPAIIRIVVSLAMARKWITHQLDVKNAFLHGALYENVYIRQSHGFIDRRAPDHVCLLKKSLHSLKQAPRDWY